MLTLENAVLNHKRRAPDPEADVTLRITKALLLRLFTGQAGLRDVIFGDELDVEGSRIDLFGFFSLPERAQAGIPDRYALSERSKFRGGRVFPTMATPGTTPGDCPRQRLVQNSLISQRIMVYIGLARALRSRGHLWEGLLVVAGAFPLSCDAGE